MGPAEKQNETVIATTTRSTNARAAKNTPPEEATGNKSSSMLSAVGSFLFGDHSRDDHHRHDHRRHHNKHHRHANSGSFYNHALLERKANRLSALNFDNRVSTLMSIQRQDLLKVLAYNYLASSSSSSSSSLTTSATSSSTLASSSSDRTSIQRLERQLINYENIERVELLKLAVWKSQCLLQFPSGKYRCYLDMDEWKEVGWMTQKTQVFGSSTKLVEVVAAGVLPFLSDPMTPSNTAATSTVASYAYRGGSRSAQSRSQSRTLENGGSSKAAASTAFASSATKSNVSRSVHAKCSAGNKRKRGLNDGGCDGDGHDDHDNRNCRNVGDEVRHATHHSHHSQHD